MVAWPLQDSGCIEEGGSIAASGLGTTVTAGAAHTKGAWVELITATDFPVRELLLHISGASFVAATISASMFDIGIGGAGSEVVIIPDVLCGAVVTSHMMTFRLPCRIPPGTRVAIRFQSAIASKTMEVQTYAFGGGFVPLETGGQAVTYGTSGATSNGTTPATPGAINTKGAWTELSSGITAPARFALVTIQPVSNTTITADNGLVDVGIGGSGSEVVVIPNIVFKIDTSERITYAPLLFPVSFAAGTRLACRYQGDSVNVNGKPIVAVTLFA